MGASAFAVFNTGPPGVNSGDLEDWQISLFGALYGGGALFCIIGVWFNSRLIAYLNVRDDDFVVEATRKVFNSAVGPNFFIMQIGFHLVLYGMVMTAYLYNLYLSISMLFVLLFVLCDCADENVLGKVCWGRIDELAISPNPKHTPNPSRDPGSPRISVSSLVQPHATTVSAIHMVKPTGEGISHKVSM